MFSGGLFENLTVGELARKIGVDLKKLENFFEVRGGWKTLREISDHKNHRDEGVEYRSDCELCRL